MGIVHSPYRPEEFRNQYVFGGGSDHLNNENHRAPDGKGIYEIYQSITGTERRQIEQTPLFQQVIVKGSKSVKIQFLRSIKNQSHENNF